MEPENTLARSKEILEKLYQEAIDLLQKAENVPVKERSALLSKADKSFEQCSSIVDTLDLFSNNESIEDVATNNIKYLLLPACRARVITLSECGSNRLDQFTKAEGYVQSFFESLINLNIISQDVKQSLENLNINSMTSTKDQTDNSSLASAMQLRNQKIEKYKRTKALAEELQTLESVIKTSGENVDEETIRDYYTKLVKKWTDETLDSLEKEIKPSIFFERNRDSSGSIKSDPPHQQKPTSFKPFTITKDSLKKQVFGLGYPSAPSVTVDQFITKKIKDGDLAFHSQKEVYGNSLQRYAEQPNLRRDQEDEEQANREELEDKNDENELIRKRNWDEFKDENPRGSGNRHNQG